MPNPWVDRLLDVLLAPALWLSVLLALFYSVLFTLWRGGLRQLGRDIVAGLLGFGMGHVAGSLSGVTWLRVGEVQVLGGTVGALALLALGRRLWPVTEP